jgi:hypothetical protein
MSVHAHRNPSAYDSQRPPLHAPCRVVSRRVARGLQWHRSTTPHRRQAQTHHQPESKLPSQEPLTARHAPTVLRRYGLAAMVRGAARLPAAHVYAYTISRVLIRVAVPLPSATQPPCHPAQPTSCHRLQPSTHIRPCLRQRDHILQPEQDRPSLPTGCCDVSGQSGLSLTFPPYSSFPFSISKLLFLCALLLS